MANRSKAAGATVAQVSFSDADGYGAVGASEQRGLPIFAPRGVSYRPCEGDSLLLLTADGAPVCAGVLNPPDGLGAGEVRLRSSGGAEIWLRNSGDILLNGVTITPSGRIIPPEG